MTTFKSDIGNDPARTPRLGGVIARKASFTVPAGFTFGADDVDLFTLPKNAVLLDMWASNVGTGAATVDVGDAADEDRFIAAAARGTTITRASLAAGLNFALTADTVVKAVFNAAPDAGNVVTVAASYVLTA